MLLPTGGQEDRRGHTGRKTMNRLRWSRKGRDREASGSCAVQRCGAEDGSTMRNRLTWVAYAATCGHVTFWPVLLLRTTSGSVAL